jgi:hypothetical protein
VRQDHDRADPGSGGLVVQGQEIRIAPFGRQERAGGTRDMDYELTGAPHQRLRETITPRASQNPKAA